MCGTTQTNLSRIVQRIDPVDFKREVTKRRAGLGQNGNLTGEKGWWTARGSNS